MNIADGYVVGTGMGQNMKISFLICIHICFINSLFLMITLKEESKN